MLVSKYLFFTGLAAAAVTPVPVKERSAAENSPAVLAALMKIEAATLFSGQTSVVYNPNDFNTTVTLIRGATDLIGDFFIAGFTAQRSPSLFSEAGAQSIVDYLNKAFNKDTVITEDDFDRNKKEFQQTGLIKFIQGGLILLREAVGSASSLIQDKFPADKLPAAQKIFNKIEQDYADAQAFFNAP